MTTEITDELKNGILWVTFNGVVRRIRTGLSLPRKLRTYPEQS
ncbi:hypothetical protein RUM4293_03674 [Ruegeria atlantica]|uniref:Uncharacterized protein n=1 Tax=Ruegeria atlantica TaxID=81569 RepID=A0A0P1E983_9RHOB|nr:hypothetical protein RUM4293_03674 [Ruegeria atlantica]